jgi:hypothetical protein
MKRLESADVNGTVSLAIGRDNLGLIQFNSDTTLDQHLRVNLVVTVRGGKIVSMQDHRRETKARRAAKIAV